MGSSTGRPLQPLRIPQGWEVRYNQFFDVEPKFKTLEDVSYDFGEDILMLVNTRSGVWIDLGWYPAPGERAVQAHRNPTPRERVANAVSWQNPLRELRTRSKQKVTTALEQWMDWYSNHEPAAECRRRNRARPKK